MDPPPPTTAPPEARKAKSHASNKAIPAFMAFQQGIAPPSRPPPEMIMPPTHAPPAESDSLPRPPNALPTPEAKLEKKDSFLRSHSPTSAGNKKHLEGMVAKKVENKWGDSKLCSLDGDLRKLTLYRGTNKASGTEETISISEFDKVDIGKKDKYLAFELSCRFDETCEYTVHTFGCNSDGDQKSWVQTIQNAIETAKTKSREFKAKKASVAVAPGAVVFGLAAPPPASLPPPSSGPSGGDDNSNPFNDAKVNPFESGEGMNFGFNPLEMAMQKKEKKKKKTASKKEDEETPAPKPKATAKTNTDEKPKALASKADTVAPSKEELVNHDNHDVPVDGKAVVAKHNFSATEREHLSILEGQSLTLWETFEDGWTRVIDAKTGKSGIVPTSYINFDAPAAAPDSSPATNSKLKVILALYSFSATDDIHITISEGQKLGLVETFDDGWTSVSDLKSGKSGVVPTSYLNLNYEETPAEKAKPPTTAKDKGSLLASKGVTTLSSIKGGAVPTAGHKNSDTHPSDPDYVDGRNAQIKFDFTPTANVEPEDATEKQIAVKKGDVVTIVEEFDDGWTFIMLANRERGLVPSTYIDIMDSKPRGMSSVSATGEDSVPTSKREKNSPTRSKALPSKTSWRDKATSFASNAAEKIPVVDAPTTTESPAPAPAPAAELVIPSADAATTKLLKSSSARGKRNSFFGAMPNLTAAANSVVKELEVEHREAVSTSIPITPAIGSNNSRVSFDGGVAAPVVITQDSKTLSDLAKKEEKLKEKQIQLWRVQQRLRLLTAAGASSSGNVPASNYGAADINTEVLKLKNVVNSSQVEFGSNSGGGSKGGDISENVNSKGPLSSSGGVDPNGLVIPSYNASFAGAVDDASSMVEVLLKLNEVEPLEKFNGAELTQHDSGEGTKFNQRIVDAQALVSRNERRVRELRLRTLAEYYQKLLNNRNKLASLFSEIETREKDAISEIDSSILALEDTRSELQQEREKLNKDKEETELWHVQRMKELANIATALHNRHLAAKKIIAASSSSNKSARLQTLEQRAMYLTGVLLGKEREYESLKERLDS